MSIGNLQNQRLLKYLTSPIYLLFITIFVIFVTETLVMFLILSHEHTYQYAVLDALLLITTAFPLLYVFLFRPYMRAQKSAEEALKKSETRYRSLVESTRNSIYLVDRNYNYLFMNREHMSRLGLYEGNYEGRPFSDFHSHEETKLFIQKADKVFETGECAEYEYQSFKDGRYFLQTYSPVKDENEKTVAVTIVSKNITALKKMEMELRALSITDDLTGVYNRRGFLAMAELQLKTANRQNTGLLLLFIDIDGLKLINDTLGHAEGSRALVDAADLLRQTFRESDVIARIGGDEFVVLVMEKPGVSAESLSQRLQINLDAYNASTNRVYNLKLSLGIVRYDPESPRSINHLLSQADTLMYEQKREKKKIGNH